MFCDQRFNKPKAPRKKKETKKDKYIVSDLELTSQHAILESFKKIIS